MNDKTIEIVEAMPKRERALAPIQLSADATPMQMVAAAVARGATIDELKQLMDLRDRYEATEARKAYVKAMAAFKAEPTRILKSKFVNVPGGAKFNHATLADVVDGVVANLSKHGLSHNWITEQSPEQITVTCVVTHELGHSERTQMSAAPDNGPGRNKIQAVGSTITYLQRYSLMSLLGLAAKDMDNDGGTAQPKTKPAEPEGFANWSLDMEAVADEGLERLQAEWKKAPDAFRRYVVKNDEAWWNSCKAKAKKRDPA